MFDFKRIKKNIPKLPGVYLMKDKAGGILYVGKAGDLRRRVSSYFERPQDTRISKMLSLVSKIDWRETDTVVEALILEAELIKRHSPPYNIKDKDDKSFLYVVITREKFSRVLMLRYKEAAFYGKPLVRFGPFTSPTSLRQALKILRRIFQWNTHQSNLSTSSRTKNKYSSSEIEKLPKPCFDYQIGLCPGTCIGVISATEYRKNIRQLIGFFRDEKKKIIREFKVEMRRAAKDLRYEEAAKWRGRIFALEHIHDVALLDKLNFGDNAPEVWRRVEGYDISNISGTSATGSMVVFENRMSAKSEYRKFKIKTITGSNDVGMLAEVLRRRLAHGEWPMPDAILVDGGVSQVNAARSVLIENKLTIPVIGIAKGPERKRNDFIYPLGMHKEIFRMRDILVRVRDEAHRFAVKYHRELREELL